MIGTTISHYEIVKKLGEGGMGVVYKVRDTKLNRYVAMKVLSAKSVSDPDRKRRIIQEAKTASALNHPNIITIHEIANENGLDFIIMELVEGRTLSDVIGHKGLKLNEALRYAIQAADALAKAHAAGIIHRDLKPANIMINNDRLVKVLDFGLAKLTERSIESASGPTQTLDDTPVTEQGSIMGTVAYMSPEQAEGKQVDARSDIFSFGSLLYETVSGRRAFQGDTKMAVLAAILQREPQSLTEILPATHRDLDKAITRCLRKDPGRRFQSMADLKITLEEIKEESDSDSLTSSQPGRRRLRSVWAAALLCLTLAGAGALWFYPSANRDQKPDSQARPLTTFPGSELYPAFSPDGSQVAFSWDGENQDNFDIYVQLIGSGRPLRLTTDPGEDYGPVWSPDGKSIAFLRNSSAGKTEILLVPPLGGTERKLGETLSSASASREFPRLGWSPDGKWLALPDRRPSDQTTSLFLLKIEDGERRLLISPPKESPGGYGDPAFSPDGRLLAFVRYFTRALSDLYVLPVSALAKSAGEPKRLTSQDREVNNPAWTMDSRELVFASNAYRGIPSLWRVAISGSAVPQRLSGFAAEGSQPAVSPWGSRLAFSRSLQDENVWIVGLPGPGQPAAPPKTLIASTRDDYNAQFSPDGKRIAFVSTRSGTIEIWTCDRDGLNAVQLTNFGGPVTSNPRWSPNGERLLFDSRAGGIATLYLIDAGGGAPKPLPVHGIESSWSHDGKWIYYGTPNTAPPQVWKMPVQGGPARQITRNGGAAALESRDGKFIYYAKSFAVGTSLWKVPVEGGVETLVFDGLSYSLNFAVVDDGVWFRSLPNSAGKAAIEFFRFADGNVARVLDIFGDFGEGNSGIVREAAPPVLARRLDKHLSLGISVSPDGRSLAYSQADHVGSDLMLVENFH